MYIDHCPQIRDLPSLINGPDVLVAAGKEHFITLIEFHYDTVESEVHNRIRDYERSESRLHSRMEMRRMSIRSRLDSDRMDMRSRLDSNRMDMRSRLGSNHWDSYRGRAGSRLTRIQEKRGRTSEEHICVFESCPLLCCFNHAYSHVLLVSSFSVFLS